MCQPRASISTSITWVGQVDGLRVSQLPSSCASLCFHLTPFAYPQGDMGLATNSPKPSHYICMAWARLGCLSPLLPQLEFSQAWTVCSLAPPHVCICPRRSPSGPFSHKLMSDFSLWGIGAQGVPEISGLCGNQGRVWPVAVTFILFPHNLP